MVLTRDGLLMPPSGASKVQVLSRAQGWWKNGVRVLLPISWLEILASWPRTLKLHTDGDNFRLTGQRAKLFRRSSTATELCAGQWTDIVETIVRQRRIWRRLLAVELVVPSTKCLFLNKEIPVAARPKAGEIAAIEIVRLVPLPANEFYSSFYYDALDAAVPNGKVSMTIAVCKRQLIERAIRMLAELSIRPSALRIEDGHFNILPADLLAGEPAPQRNISQKLNILTVILFAAGCTIWIGSNIYELVQKRSYLNTIEIENVGLQKQVAEAKTKLEAGNVLYARIAGARQRKETEVGVTAIWEEVTQILPPTAWINELRVEEDVVHFDGFANSAAELLSLFSGSKDFQDPEFASPITRDPQKNVERFFIQMKLRKRSSGPNRIGLAEGQK
jgi:Tfp pilus assembly protein PilN